MERHLGAKCCLPRFVLRSLAIDVPKMTRADSRQPSGAPAPTHEGKPGHACRSNRASDCVKLVPVKVLAGRTHDLDEDLRFSHPAIAAGLRCGCQPATPVLNSTTRFNPNHVPQGTICKMVAQCTQQGKSIDQAIEFAQSELEGFMRT